MSHVVVIGAQWGDEGKGKIVDYLSEKADVVVRFQGGHNAGHTLVIDGVTFKLSLLPSGIVRPNKISVIGNGVVIDPYALLKEIELVSKQGVKISPDNLKIAENAPLILPLHQQQDLASEASLGEGKIGTTGRGIGPAYEDKVARRALRVCDLFDDKILTERLTNLLDYHNSLRKGRGAAPLDFAATFAELKAIGEKIQPYACPVWRLLDIVHRSGKNILFEGAQGVMLDTDHGTYPYVTSSNTVSGAITAGSGFGASKIGTVLGITKAYTTRVGSGPFPTELKDKVGEMLGERGHEFGTVTGRKRRTGWFDAVMVRQAIKVSGITGIVLTKLDVLDVFDELKICVGYHYEGKMYDYLPASITIQAGVEPIYEVLPGWKENTFGCKSFDAMPEKALKYIKRIETLVEAPVLVVSTSPKREDTIEVKDPFNS